MATPFSRTTGRRMPPPGWTALACSGGTVGVRSRQPSRSSSKAGRRTRGTGPSSISERLRRAGSRASAGRTSRRGRRRSLRRGRRSSGGRARRATASRSAPAGGRSATKTRSGVSDDAALHRRAGEQVDDRLALDRDVVGREVLGQLGALGRDAAPRSARPRARPGPRSRPAAAAAAGCPPPSAARTAGAATRDRRRARGAASSASAT